MKQWTPGELEIALGKIEDALSRLVAECSDVAEFGSALRRATAQVEANAGEYVAYVNRRIDAMLVGLLRTHSHVPLMPAPASAPEPPPPIPPPQAHRHQHI